MSTTETPEASATADRPKKLRGPRRKRSELNAEQQDLAAKYLPLARTLTKPVKLKWSQYHDELDSAAYLALVEAAQAFEPRRGVKFATFARFRILGALYDIQRHLVAKEYPREMPNVPRSFHFVPGDVERSLLMLTSPDAPVGTEIEAAEEVERWFRSLPRTTPGPAARSTSTTGPRSRPPRRSAASSRASATCTPRRSTCSASPRPSARPRWRSGSTSAATESAGHPGKSALLRKEGVSPSRSRSVRRVGIAHHPPGKPRGPGRYARPPTILLRSVASK